MKILLSTDPSFQEKWNELENAISIVHPFGRNPDILYQKAYLEGTLKDIQDLSAIVLSKQGMPLWGVRLFKLIQLDQSASLSCMGRPFSVLEREYPHPDIKAGFSWIKNYLDEVLKNNPGISLHFRDHISGGILSKTALHLLEQGASAQSFATQMISLKPDEAKLRADISGSFRNLINWGLKEMTFNIVTADNPNRELFDQFKNLHFEAAKRETRPQKTWALQYEAITHHDAFLITGHWNGVMVSGGLFLLGKNYCFYGVGAANRELFEKPLSHAIIWKAILHSKATGCIYIELGDRLFPQYPKTGLTAKELSISSFKKRFGGMTHLGLDLTLSI